jgi:hypothetical protein
MRGDGFEGTVWLMPSEDGGLPIIYEEDIVRLDGVALLHAG